jgi:hypothetical protein
MIEAAEAHGARHAYEEGSRYEAIEIRYKSRWGGWRTKKFRNGREFDTWLDKMERVPGFEIDPDSVEGHSEEYLRSLMAYEEGSRVPDGWDNGQVEGEDKTDEPGEEGSDTPDGNGNQKKRAGEVIEEMYALVSDDGYMLGATDGWSDARSKSYWRYSVDNSHLDGGAELMTLVNVPLALAEKFKDMGTSAQRFSDGYDAWAAARKFSRGSGIRLAASEREAASGLYGHSKRVQADCEGCIRRVQKSAATIARNVYARNEKVAEFLATHARRADSLPAQILVAALKEVGPKVATQMRLAELRLNQQVNKTPAHTDIMAHLAKQPKVALAQVQSKVVFADLLSAAQDLHTNGLIAFDGVTIAKVTDADAQTGEGIKETTNKNASGAANIKYLASLSPQEKVKILATVAKHYGVSVQKIEAEVTDPEAEALYEYIGNDSGLQRHVYQEFKRMHLVSDKTAKSYGLYGFGEKVAKLGLQACTDLRHEAGKIAHDLHHRRADRHAAINDFFANHSKQANCQFSRLLSASYPELKTASAPTTVQGWLEWAN